MVLLTGNRGFNQISGNAFVQREGIIYGPVGTDQNTGLEVFVEVITVGCFLVYVPSS